MERLDTHHRWLDILTGLGVPAKFLRNRHGPCPMCPRQPEVRMSMCPVLGTLVPSGIHRTCRIVTGLAAYSASLPRKSKHGHTWPPPRARVDTVQNRRAALRQASAIKWTVLSTWITTP